MKKRILSMLMVIVMVITMFPVYSIPTSALTSGDFEYEVISENEKTAAITDYSGSTKELEIPSQIDGYTITSIGSYAFNSTSSLESLTIPESVTIIETSAFRFCTGLEVVMLPNSIKSIYADAFSECWNLKHVLYAGTELDWENVFIGTNNTYLTAATYHFETDKSDITYEISIAPNCINTGHGNFKCNKCNKVICSMPIDSLGHTFENDVCTVCEALKFEYSVDESGNAAITRYNGKEEYVIIPSTIDGYTVTTIAEGTFVYSPVIKSITIPATITSVSAKALRESAVSNIIVDENNEAFCMFDGALYNKDVTKLILPNVSGNSYTIPEGVTTIGEYAFNGVVLYSVDFPSTLKTIEYAAFAGSDIRTLVFPEGFETIGDYAFYACEELYKVVLPTAMKSIGDWAFVGCDVFSEIVWPESLESIGDYAFAGLSYLNIDLADDLKSIGANAFQGCSIEKINIPASVTSIGEGCFLACCSLSTINVAKDNSAYCSVDGVLFTKDMTTLLTYPARKSLAEYKVPDTVVDISNTAFAYNNYLMSVEIPEGVASIGDCAFESCLNLKLLSIKSTMTTIGEEAFNNCSALSHVLFIGDETDWNSLAIDSGNDYLTGTTRHCETDMSAIARKIVAEPTCTQEGTASCVCTICETELLTLPVSALGHDIVNNVCTRCSTAEFSYSLDENNNAIITGYLGSATDAVIPSEIDGYTVTEIGVQAFANNEVIRNVTLPNTITKIGDMAFMNTFLTSIYIPSSVKEIGFGAFAMCLIEDITVDEQNTEYSSKDGVLFDKEQKTLIAYPIGKTRTRYTVPSSVTTIGDYAFMYSPNIKNVQIPDSVTKIGMAAFTYSQNLSNITWPKNLTEIGQMAFMYTGITNVTIPDGVTTIEASTFYYCTSLSTVTMGNGLTTIGEEAFSNCVSLTNITIPDKVIIIEDSAFSNCNMLNTLTLGSGIETVGISAFEHCSTLTTVNYNGTKCQWNQIAFNAGNSYLLNSTIHYKGDHAFSDFNFDTNAGVGESCAIKRTCSLCDGVETINFILGDVNEDGVVDSQDYNMIVEASVVTTILTYAQTLAADINGDGAVDTFDAVCIDLALNGLLDNAYVINMRTIAIVPKQDDENE